MEAHDRREMARETNAERLERIEQDERARVKAIFKDALNEWVKEHPGEGKALIGEAIANYITSTWKNQMERLGLVTLGGLGAIAVGLLMWAWWKTTGWKL